MTGARDACHCSSWVKKGRMHDWGRDTRGLMRGEADMALRLFRPSEPDLMIRRTVDCGAGVYAAKSYATAKGLPSSPHELTNHPLILFEEQMSNIPAVNWLERHTQGSGGHLRVGSPTVATRLIAAGAGIGVTTCLEGDSDPSLVRVFPEPIAFKPCYIVYHESLRGSARIRAVADLLGEFLSTKEGEISGRPGSGMGSAEVAHAMQHSPDVDPFPPEHAQD